MNAPSQLPFDNNSQVSRETVAAFLISNKDLVKQRFRAQLEHEVEDGSLYGSSDFFASLLRRMDARLAAGSLDGDAHAVLQSIYLEALRDYSRQINRLDDHRDRSHALAIAGEDTSHPGQADHARERPITQSLAQVDEQIARLRAAGLSHALIAPILGMTAAAVRKRWSRCVQSVFSHSSRRAS